MGNAIASRFNLPKEHTATAGHVSNWKIWPGKSKESGQLVSIWAFDKTDLSKRKPNPVVDKVLIEQVFQIMKKDFYVIKDSKVCSSIIQCLEVVEDSKSAIAFTTERIVCSLADILNNFENVPGGFGEHSNFFDSGASVSEMEISCGLLNIAQGLQYLHTVQRKLHLNITPESIVITATGQWKLCGFGLSLAFVQGDVQRIASPYFLQPTPSAAIAAISRLEPDLRYSSPETTDGGFNPPGVRYLTPVADMFSLGILFYEVYRHNLKYTVSERGYHHSLITVTNNDVAQHHYALSTLQGTDFSFLPPGLVNIVAGMMQMSVQMRSGTADVVNHSYFVTGAQAVLNMINTLHTRDLGTMSSQLLSLDSQLEIFPPRILIHAVLPVISKLCLQSHASLWVYALPLHARMSQLMPEDKYVFYASPYLAEALSSTAIVGNSSTSMSKTSSNTSGSGSSDHMCPIEMLQVFLNYMEFLCRTFGVEFFQANVTTLFCSSLERQNMYLQNLALEKLAEEYVYSMFTPITLTAKLLPQLCKEACKSPEPNIKIQALYIISLVTWKLDQGFIANSILPSLKFITDNEKNPLVSMSVVGNFESISQSLGLEYVATSILPILQAMLLDKGLDKNQFEIVVNMIKRLLKKILDQRTAELNISPISVAEVPGSDMVDPFAAAKAVIAASKQRNAANNYGMSSSNPTYRARSGSSASSNNTTTAATTNASNNNSATAASIYGSNNSTTTMNTVQSVGTTQLSSLTAYSTTTAPTPPVTPNTVPVSPGLPPPAPTRAPPPLPSVPPPSTAPPLPPSLSAKNTNTTTLSSVSGYGGTSSYTSGVGLSAAIQAFPGNNSSTISTSNTTSAPTVVLSSYQSSFAGTLNSNNNNSSSSTSGGMLGSNPNSGNIAPYVTPYPLSYAHGTSTTATSNSNSSLANSNNASIPTLLPTNNTITTTGSTVNAPPVRSGSISSSSGGNSNNIEGEENKNKSSIFGSWFGGKSSTTGSSTANTTTASSSNKLGGESLLSSSSYNDSVYVPPALPLQNNNNNNNSSNNNSMGMNGINNTSSNAFGNNATMLGYNIGNTPPPTTMMMNNNSSGNGLDEMDDFINSFSKNKQQQQPSLPPQQQILPATTNNTLLYSNNNNNIMSVATNITTPINITASLPTTAAATTTVGGNLSLEEQILQAQAEIARLSALPTQHSWTAPVPAATTAAAAAAKTTNNNNSSSSSKYVGFGNNSIGNSSSSSSSSTIAVPSSAPNNTSIGYGNYNTGIANNTPISTYNNNYNVGVAPGVLASQSMASGGQPVGQNQFYGSHNSMNVGYAPATAVNQSQAAAPSSFSFMNASSGAGLSSTATATMNVTTSNSIGSTGTIGGAGAGYYNNYSGSVNVGGYSGNISGYGGSSGANNNNIGNLAPVAVGYQPPIIPGVTTSTSSSATTTMLPTHNITTSASSSFYGSNATSYPIQQQQQQQQQQTKSNNNKVADAFDFLN